MDLGRILEEKHDVTVNSVRPESTLVRCERLLDQGRYEDAAVLVAELANDKSLAASIARARLALGRGDAKAAQSELAKTTADYKLFALNGGPPKRPGLFRVGKGKGATIEVEVWALSPEALGRFIAEIPSPLAVGTIWLSDGTAVKGFTVEAEGILGAEDISSFGGWRAYSKSLV